jgi:hypothetical protein
LWLWASCGAIRYAGKFSNTGWTVSPDLREWVVRLIWTSFYHSSYSVVKLTTFPIVVLGRTRTCLLLPRFPTHVGGHQDPAVENDPQVVDQLHGDGGESAKVLCSLLPPCVAHHCNLFSEGYDALYEKGHPGELLHCSSWSSSKADSKHHIRWLSISAVGACLRPSSRVVGFLPDSGRRRRTW